MEFRYDFEYLVHLLYCAIHNVQPQEKPQGISFENVFEIGKAHEVANIAFLSVEKLQQKPEAALYSEWQVYYYHSVQRDARQRSEYAAITELLTSNQIRWTEAQGTITKTLYPVSNWRMMSDIDLLVDAENIGRIEELLPALGEVDIKHYQDNELNVFPAHGSEIEFHSEFFTEFYEGALERYAGAIHHPFEHSTESPENPYHWVLDLTSYYLYSLLHTVKHYEYAGCGIRRIVDMYYLEKALGNQVDKAYINEILQKYGFADYADRLWKLERYWFEDVHPDTDITEVLLDVVCSGNHGTYSIKLRNELRREASNGNMASAKRKKALRFLFPTKEHMYEGYPQFAEKGYSLFTCHVLRAVNHLKPSELKKMIALFLRIKKSK